MASTSRYELLLKLASGGMATVFIGRVRGPLGFSRLVAIKRAHPHLLEDPLLARMLVDEAKLASRIHHPHVVAVLDVERDPKDPTDLRLVMDYVEGASLSELVAAATEAGVVIPPGVAVRVVLDACAGLQVAHELTDERGAPLGLVHRDVSPHNVLVGLDGLARVSDFGIAKSTARPGSTTTGTLKGKLSYMAPEYVSSGQLDVRADVFALGVVLWELLARRRLFVGANELDILQQVADAKIPRLSAIAPARGSAFDDLLATVLAKSPEERFSTARAFGNALQAEATAAGSLATYEQVASLVQQLLGEKLATRRELVRARVLELDAAGSRGTTQDGPLRNAVAAAEVILSESTAKTSEVDPLGASETLDGSGVSSTGTRLPRRSPYLRWFVVAAFVGASAALLAFGLMSRDSGSAARSPASADGASGPSGKLDEPARRASEPPNPTSIRVDPSASPTVPPASVAPPVRGRPGSVSVNARTPPVPVTPTSASSGALDAVAPNPYPQ
jgi:eukaryotic-like serine/threonine-protein kinase